MAVALILTLAVLSLLLLLHDIVPIHLGGTRWNNVGHKPTGPLLINVISNTLVGIVPLYLAIVSRHHNGSSPGRTAIRIILIVVFVGELTSWWKPWLFGGISPARQFELAAISDNTLSFIPSRHGVTPNALHCIIHLLTLAALIEVIVLVNAGSV